jgi:cytochrome b
MAPTVKVWDPVVRIFHWCLVISFAVAWLSGDELKRLHIWAGYAAAALVAFRIIWGLAGGHYARFSQFVRAPADVAGYIGDIVRGRERRYLGHNPAGGAMIVALIVGLVGVSVTGWMFTTDTFWGVAWVEDTHAILANMLLALVGLHVAGVVLASLRHHENLIRAMVTGRKRRPTVGDVA